MKKLISVILSVVMMMGCGPMFEAEAEKAENEVKRIYVSPSGDDGAPGTESAPLRTLEAAKEAAKKINDGKSDIEVVLRGGEYRLEETLSFTPEDGGREGKSVTWRGYDGENAVISGFTDITGWEIFDKTKNIYRAEVGKGFNTRQLYVNKVKARRARSTSYEGNPYSNLDRTCELGINARNNRELYFYKDEVGDWNNFEKVEVHLLTAWTDNVLRLKKYGENESFKLTDVDNDGEGTVSAAAVKLQEPESARLFNRAHPDITGSTLGYKSRSYYYFENAYEFIDEDGEWYLDESEGALYYKAPAGTDMGKAEVTAPSLETIVKIEGTSGKKVSNLSFKNITFEGSTWLKPSEEGLVGGQASQYVLSSSLQNEVTVYHPASAFMAVNAERLCVSGCVFRHMGATAIDYYQGVTDSGIFGNEIYDIAGNGISAAKFVRDEKTEFHEAYNPSDKAELCVNISIVNNEVHDIGTQYEGAVAIAAGYPKNIVIAHNEIYNAPYSGISVGFGWTDRDNAMSGNMIFANRLHDVGLVLCDFGAIYTLSKQPGSLCARNYIYNVSAKSWFDYAYSAMYFDEQTEGYTITENLTYDIGKEAWGGGINFNGCAAKNANADNYLNTNPETNGITKSIAAEAGVSNMTSSEAASEARRYHFEATNPTEAYDPSDYAGVEKLEPINVTATGANIESRAEYAADGKGETVYTLSGQTESSMKNEYLLLELKGDKPLKKVIIRRQYNAAGTTDNSYWTDWCLAVGCELQGSFDKNTWETIGAMNPWPDNTGETSKEIFELETPKNYKFVRYIRTKFKQGDDYAVWRWREGDGGNRLNIKEIELYTPYESGDGEGEISMLYEKGSFVESYNPIVSRHTSGGSRAWRDGFVSGNGEIGYVTSGEPYTDAFVYQNVFFNYPSADPREIPAELTGQLEEARENVFKLNDKWEIKGADGSRRSRTYLYSFHPGHQLRLTNDYTDAARDYARWTDYETAETGVRFSDKYGQWTRKAFTSRVDGVCVTKIEKSSLGHLINMTVSIDDIDDMPRAQNGLSKVQDQRYKKIVPEDASYIAQTAHYPVYEKSELRDGGYCGLTRIIVEGENAKKTRVVSHKDDPMLLGDNAAVKIENAEAVYLITALDRTFEMTGAENPMAEFEKMQSYALLDELSEKTAEVREKYTKNGKFDYESALSPSAELQKAEFDRVSFELEGDEEYALYDNNALIEAQRSDTSTINHEFMRRAYEQARYALISCGGYTAPRLYGMWTGEWNLGWRGIYTLDANVNLQVSSMNTSNLAGDFQEGYITFFLRNAPDFMENAKMAYGMHDAIQLSVNADADMAKHVEYDNAYPFEYWNAGASWCLLPIFEYWQCFGNREIPINEYMRFDNLQKVLGTEDGGLSDEEFAALKERGYLDLERDILLPLLIKQANFWEQIVTPRYYIDKNGKACHDENKTELLPGEKYMIIPTYSPENSPIGYNSTITANATMDIAAARDGLDMVCALEEAVGREGWEENVEKLQSLKNSIADYKFDTDGALKEWAMEEYTENNNHRHLSHLYVAWPGYETQNDPDLANAANIALDNRNRYNTDDATAGHGWMHKALVEARLKRGDGMMRSLLQMMGNNAYYSSLMTDHDTNRRNDTYCTDTAFGTLGAVNEAVVFSNTGEIEIIPALPSDWTKGRVNGLMARSRAEVSELSWDIENESASVTVTSLEDGNNIRLGCGEEWRAAYMDGERLEVLSDERGKYVEIEINKGESKTIEFELLITKLSRLTPEVTATAGEHPEYAADGDAETVYTVSNQSEESVGEQYIVFEFDGERSVDKIVLRRAVLSGESNYWADWCLAVGCELQGSFDGNEWETISVMNPKPDGTDNTSELVIEPSSPKAYKYIRYIRTKIKTKDDYGAWKFPSDHGNRLSIADIGFYGAEPYFKAKVVKRDENGVVISAESGTDRSINIVAAAYNGKMLASSSVKEVSLESFSPSEIRLDIKAPGEITLFLWDKNLKPLYKKLSA